MYQKFLHNVILAKYTNNSRLLRPLVVGSKKQTTNIKQQTTKNAATKCYVKLKQKVTFFLKCIKL